MHGVGYGAKATYRFLVMAATWRVDPSLVAAAAVEVAARRAALAAAAAAAAAQAASAMNPAAADTPSWRGAAALFDLSTRAPSGAGDATAATAVAPRARAEPQLLLPARMAQMEVSPSNAARGNSGGDGGDGAVAQASVSPSVPSRMDIERTWSRAAIGLSQNGRKRPWVPPRSPEPGVQTRSRRRRTVVLGAIFETERE